MPLPKSSVDITRMASKRTSEAPAGSSPRKRQRPDPKRRAATPARVQAPPHGAREGIRRFYDFIAARMSVWACRTAGLAPEDWTKDPKLRWGHFCNVCVLRSRAPLRAHILHRLAQWRGDIAYPLLHCCSTWFHTRATLLASLRDDVARRRYRELDRGTIFFVGCVRAHRRRAPAPVGSEADVRHARTPATTHSVHLALQHATHTWHATFRTRFPHAIHTHTCQ